ncbi:MAG: hypothetical protein KIT43_04300 [Bauldia sp.]|nr:hypothetical protein [Bauldia sp.]MCW5717901.1 hypothetical protein [Bauldia sp.]
MTRYSRVLGQLRRMLVLGLLLLPAAMSWSSASRAQDSRPINGLIMLIEFEHIEGVRHWETQLGYRGFTALVQVQHNVLAQYPEDFARMANAGHVIAGIHSETAFWGVPYEEQLLRMRIAKSTVEAVTGQPMRVFGSRYFAYDDNTLRAADALGIEFVLGRGTAGERAVVYDPIEYEARVISVSNVPFAEMGTGSLCDYSLWARGASHEDFAVVLDRVLHELHPSDMILVSHAYLGGAKLDWWRVYEDVLDSPDVSWRSFDQWLAALDTVTLPVAEIPVNMEVLYEVPQPAIPLEEMRNVPGLFPLTNPQPQSGFICPGCL